MVLDDAPDLMAILEDEDFIPTSSCQAVTLQASTVAGGLASTPANHAEGQGGSDIPAPSDLSGLSWAEYVQKVKETFVRARPLETVAIQASAMGFTDWMDYVVKLIPKDVKIQGEVNFKHLIAELGPIDKSQYLLQEPVVDVECCEVVDGSVG